MKPTVLPYHILLNLAIAEAILMRMSADHKMSQTKSSLSFNYLGLCSQSGISFD